MMLDVYNSQKGVYEAFIYEKDGSKLIGLKYMGKKKTNETYVGKDGNTYSKYEDQPYQEHLKLEEFKKAFKLESKTDEEIKEFAKGVSVSSKKVIELNK